MFPCCSLKMSLRIRLCCFSWMHLFMALYSVMPFDAVHLILVYSLYRPALGAALQLIHYHVSSSPFTIASDWLHFTNKRFQQQVDCIDLI